LLFSETGNAIVERDKKIVGTLKKKMHVRIIDGAGGLMETNKEIYRNWTLVEKETRITGNFLIFF